jgi:polyhydroxyalkanoate synthesis regulator phasin
MAQRDLLNRSLDAGREVSQKTQDRVEALLRDLTRAAEDQAQQAQQLVQELVERSRTTTEQIIDVIDRELRSQVNALGLATRADIDRLEARIDELQVAAASEPPAVVAKPAARQAPARKAVAKKAAKAAKVAKKPAKKAVKKAAKKAKAVPASSARRRTTSVAPRHEAADGAPVVRRTR